MTSPVASIRQDGYAVLKGVLPANQIDEARERCLSDFDRSTLWFAGGTVAGHVAYTLPPDLEIIGQLIANTSVVNCAREILGPNFEVSSVGCNVNLPGSGFQPAHADGDADGDRLCVNLPLGDVSEDNGSLELFTRTHEARLTYTEFVRASRESIARRATTSSGDVIIRFPHLWHRGTPNRRAVPRFMIGVVLGRQGAMFTATSLSPANIAAIERAGVRAHMIPSDSTMGEFRPTYFPRTPKGIAKELAWRYMPSLYNLLRRAA